MSPCGRSTAGQKAYRESRSVLRRDPGGAPIAKFADTLYQFTTAHRNLARLQDRISSGLGPACYCGSIETPSKPPIIAAGSARLCCQNLDTPEQNRKMPCLQALLSFDITQPQHLQGFKRDSGGITVSVGHLAVRIDLGEVDIGQFCHPT